MSEYRLLQDLVIPAGTVFSQAARERGGKDAVEAVIGLGKDATAWLVVHTGLIPDAPDWLARQ